MPNKITTKEEMKSEWFKEVDWKYGDFYIRHSDLKVRLVNVLSKDKVEIYREKDRWDKVK